MNSISSCWPDSGCLRAEHLVEVQVVAVAERLAEVPVDALALQLDVGAERRLARAAGVVARVAHGNTQAGTFRQPCSSSTSSGFQSGSNEATSDQKRLEWFMCRRWQSSWIIR